MSQPDLTLDLSTIPKGWFLLRFAHRHWFHRTMACYLPLVGDLPLTSPWLVELQRAGSPGVVQGHSQTSPRVALAAAVAAARAYPK